MGSVSEGRARVRGGRGEGEGAWGGVEGVSSGS